MMIVCEIAEAMEEHRAGRPMVWHNCSDENKRDTACERNNMCVVSVDGIRQTCRYFDAKPEGIAVEVIDALIRILDWCGKEGLDVDELVRVKHEYNKSRPYKHGKKF